MCRGERPGQGKRSPVWVTHIVTLGGYLHRSHGEQLALPREAYSPSAWWSTMYVNRRGHDVSKPYTSDTTDTTDTIDTNLIGNTLDCCSKEGDGETEFDPFQRPILPKTKVVDTCRKAHPKW